MIFAQSSSTTAVQWVTIGMIVSVGVAVFILTVIGLCMFYYRRERQLVHIERMRAIEMGQPLKTPDADKATATHMHNSFWIAFWLGFGVPCAVFWAAATAAKSEQLAVNIIIWIGASLASIVGVISALVLILHCRSVPQSAADKFSSKPSKVFARSEI